MTTEPSPPLTLEALAVELAGLRAENATLRAEMAALRSVLPSAESQRSGGRSKRQSIPRTSRRRLLQLGGAATVAAATSLATRLPDAHAAPQVPDTVTPWTTSIFQADTETAVLSSPSFPDPDVLQVRMGTGTVYQPLISLGLTAGLAAYDATGTGTGKGAYGSSQQGTGVLGNSEFGNGVAGLTAGFGYGVYGNSDGGAGVGGNSSTGLGGLFTGGLAPILLGLAGAPGAPATGLHNAGEIYLDSHAVVWVCVSATPMPSWVRLTSVASGALGGAITFLASPIRIVDTRGGAPITNGSMPLAGGSTLVVQVTGTSVGGISVPAGASAVVGNLTALPFANGDLTIWEDGIPRPNVSNLNYTTGINVANFVMAALSSAGKADIFAHVGTAHVIFDVTGYIP